LSEFETELFGKIPEATSVQSVLEIVKAQSLPDGAARTFLWRGQADIDWPLHSTAYRRLVAQESKFLFKNGAPGNEALSFYERGLIEQATHRGYRQLDGRRLNDFELLARLQHHGAATRLLDTTRNILVGLYFSAREAPDKMGALFGWHSHFIGGPVEGRIFSEDYETATSSLGKYDYPQSFEPTLVSPRVASQQSHLLFSRVSSHKMGSLCIDPDPRSFLAIAIPAKYKEPILTDLVDLFDIRYLTLFPDIDGFSRANAVSGRSWASHRW